MTITICVVQQDEKETTPSGIRIHHCGCNSFMTARGNLADGWYDVRCNCGLTIGLSPSGFTQLEVAAITQVDREIPEQECRCDTCDTVLVRGGCADNRG